MIIDSSAILAVFFREAGAEDVLSTILEADFAGIGSPTATETGLVLTGRLKHNATGSLLWFFQETGIEIVPFTDLHWQRAIDAYTRFGKGRHPAALNFGDCMTYATAALAGQPLLCRGDDFRKTDLSSCKPSCRKTQLPAMHSGFDGGFTTTLTTLRKTWPVPRSECSTSRVSRSRTRVPRDRGGWPLCRRREAATSG